ncbi:MAG: molecular chaperone TorD family protein [Eggerthellaceae bacterium]|nr:molecular chaperone TorD family protein [Eggerthellaceae bacterium]
MREKTWRSRAALFELLAQSFLFTGRDLVGALVSGEYREALVELLDSNGLPTASAGIEIDRLDPYPGSDADAVFHALRKEYTRLYIGTRDPLVFPFAGASYARKKGQKPLLFVGKESMAIERFMRKCAVGQAEGTNEPLDHIGSMLEFLMHLCLLKAGLIQPPEGVGIPEDAYEEFYERHFTAFAREFAAQTVEQGTEGFFIVAAQALGALPSKPL